jgi:hypothetical protein
VNVPWWVPIITLALGWALSELSKTLQAGRERRQRRIEREEQLATRQHEHQREILATVQSLLPGLDQEPGDHYPDPDLIIRARLDHEAGLDRLRTLGPQIEDAELRQHLADFVAATGDRAAYEQALARLGYLLQSVGGDSSPGSWA